MVLLFSWKKKFQNVGILPQSSLTLLAFADCVKITKIRGQAMQAASDAVDTGMVSVMGFGKDKVDKICAAASEKSGESI